MKKILMIRIYLGIIILLGITGGGLAIYNSANGPWGYSDPVEYISTAYSILHGHGLGYYEGDAQFVFTTIHPPFYSVMLSVIGLTGINLVVAARWLNVLSLVATIFIAGWIFLHFSRGTSYLVQSSLPRRCRRPRQRRPPGRERRRCCACGS